jgi:hypothetical protein
MIKVTQKLLMKLIQTLEKMDLKHFYEMANIIQPIIQESIIKNMKKM